VAAGYPIEVRGRKSGIVSAFSYSGRSVGPVLGGFITDHLGWRYVFWLAAPLGIAACVLCLTRVRGALLETRGGKMDWRGALVYAPGIALVMLGASHAGDGGAGLWMIFGGFLCLFLFGVLETHTPSPLLNVSALLRNRFFTLGCFAALSSYASTFGVTFFMSLYLQYVMDLSPRAAGFVLLIQPLMQMVVSPLVGRKADRTDPARLASLGIAMVCTGLVATAVTIGENASLLLISAELALMGIGYGTFITPNSTAIMGSVEAPQYGVASGMIGTMRTLGMVTSMTTIILIFSVLMGGQAVTKETVPGFMTSMRTAMLTFAGFSCFGAVLSLGRGRKR
jgi:MFS family permease